VRICQALRIRLSTVPIASADLHSTTPQSGLILQAFPVSSNTRISHAAVFWFSAAALTLLATSQDAMQSLRDNRQKVRTDFERLVTER
jgi:hypothetical protein